MVFYLTFILMFISLTSISVFFIVRHNENKLIFWASMVILSGGMTGLQVLLEKKWIPFAIAHNFDAYFIDASIILTTFLNVYINTFPYYGILIFYLIYNGTDFRQKWIPILISIPIWITFLFYTDILINRINSGFIASWGLCYLVITIWLAIRPITKELNFKERKNHILIACIFLVPILILNIFQISISTISDRIMTLIPFICIGSFLLVTVLYLHDAFLGVRRKSIQIVNVSTGLIHHSLKNSIGKIKLNAFNIRNALHKEQYDEIETYVKNLLQTHEDMNRTMSKIAQVVSDAKELNKKETDISVILDEVLKTLEIFPSIKIEKKYVPTRLSIDTLLITECIQNICNNAIDAMKGKGILSVEIEVRKNKVVVKISDTGCGMDTINLQNIFEPFYSTKYRSGKHFGLGMFQVKKVMNAHKGKVEAKSSQNKGTTISLIFKNRVRSLYE